ncbi:MAG: hypothetical protein ABH870_04375 [bacterium]
MSQTIFIKILEQLNSSVFVLIGLFIVALWAMYKIGGIVTTFSTHEDKIDGLSKNSEKTFEKIIRLEAKVDLIYQYHNPNSTVRSMSPISLTPVGNEIATNINAQTVLSRCLDFLEKEIEKENPKNAYDIQMVSMKIAKEKMILCLNEAELSAVKQAAYNKGILAEDVMAIFGILLRNAVLEKKGIPIAEVDFHANK